MNLYLWIGAVVVFLIIEGMTASLTSIWFAVGAFAALIAYLFKADTMVQLIVFLTVSILSVILIKKYWKKGVKMQNDPVNLDRIIGSEIVIAESCDEFKKEGIAYINDVSWKVKCISDAKIPAGTRARVVRIEGVRLIVAPAEEFQEV